MSNLVNITRRMLTTLGGPSSTLLTDLRAYYKMDETSGTNVADSTGNYDGTLQTFTFDVDGKINYGTTNTNDTGHGTDLAQSWAPGTDAPFSMSGWFNISEVRAANLLFSKANAALGAPNIYTWFDSAITLNYIMHGATGQLQVTWTSFPAPIGSWRHLVFTYDGNNAAGLKFYLNGVEYTTNRTNVSDTLTGSPSNNAVPFSVGGYRATGEPWQFKGDIDEVGVWHKELTSAEVTELYNSGTGLQYPF